MCFQLFPVKSVTVLGAGKINNVIGDCLIVALGRSPPGRYPPGGYPLGGYPAGGYPPGGHPPGGHPPGGYPPGGYTPGGYPPGGNPSVMTITASEAPTNNTVM